MTADRPTTEPRTEAACPKCGHDVDHTTACPDGCPLCLTSPRTRLADRLREMYGPSLRPDDPDHDGSMADWLRDADVLAEAAQGAAPLTSLDIDEQAALLDEAIDHADFGEVARSEVMYSAVRALHENNVEVAARTDRAAPRAEGLDEFAAWVADKTTDPEIFAEATRIMSEGAAPRAEGPTDEERAAFKRSEREAAAAIMAGDRYCPDPSAHTEGAAPLDVERLRQAITDEPWYDTDSQGPVADFTDEYASKILARLSELTDDR